MLDEVIDKVVTLAISARTLGILYISLIVPGFSVGNCPEICLKGGNDEFLCLFSWFYTAFCSKLISIMWL